MKRRLRFLQLFVLLAGALALSGCAETELASHYWKKVSWDKDTPATAAAPNGNYKVGTPYRVGTVWYHPEENFNLVETGIASWYGPDFHGKTTANGETYDQHALTAAHRTLQMPSFIRVTNLENGKSVVLRVNDRGPYKHGRIVDVSKTAAEKLGFISKGTARVKLEVLEKESREISALSKRGVNTSRIATLADLQRASGATGGASTEAPVKTAAVSAPAPVYGSPQYASLDSSLPESLQTPTITVEEIQAPGAYAASASARGWGGPPPAPMPVAYTPPAAPARAHIPATALFVQAGSFSVYENAAKLKDRLAWIAPAQIETTTVRGKTFYRVKLGPVNDVAQADSVLAKVIDSGEAGARIIR